MAAAAIQYLDEYIGALKRMGETKFREAHGSPVLIVTKQAGALGDRTGRPGETTTVAVITEARQQGLALLNRVFPLTKPAGSPPGPVSLGRTEDNDVVVDEDSISKRHCLFLFDGDEVRIADSGSTNGTSLNGMRLSVDAPVLLLGSEVITAGRFTFLFHTGPGFIRYLKQFVVG
jgi:hypothetical protein